MKKMLIDVMRLGPPIASPWRRLRGLALLTLPLMAAPAVAQSTGDADGFGGFYIGAGIAGVHGKAQATGSLNEREAENSAALRVAVGYSLTLPQRFSVAGEIYDLPTHSNLGLGDKADNVLGVALLPGYDLTPDFRLFLSVGFERLHTNSPVKDWHDFNSNTPSYGAGASYSFARSGTPLSLTARFEQADFQKITYLAQTDSVKQSRFVVSAEFHF
jgi:opacity protein-like surface antigen